MSCPPSVSWDADELVVAVQFDGDDAVFAAGIVFCKRRLFDHAAFGSCQEELIFAVFLEGNNGGDLFIAGDVEQIDDIGAFGLAAGLGDLVDLETVAFAFVGEEDEVIVGGVIKICSTKSSSLVVMAVMPLPPRFWLL